MNSIKIISAMSKNKVIGFNGQIPWRIPEEMEHFKKTTSGEIVIMGRETFQSTGILKDRFNIILTRDTAKLGEFYSGNSIFLNSVEQCLEYIPNLQLNAFKNSSIYVIGGEQIYREFEPYAEELILSEIPIEIEGDTYFPIDFQNKNEWDLYYVQYRITYTVRRYFKIKI